MANRVFHWSSTYCECTVDVVGQEPSNANEWEEWIVSVTHKCNRHASLPDTEVIGLLESVALEFSRTHDGEDYSFETWADEQVWREREAAIPPHRYGKQVTRWSPDTCGCVVEYEWDDTHVGVLSLTSEGKSVEEIAQEVGISTDEVKRLASTEEKRVHKPRNVVRRCKRHAGMSDAELHAQLSEENPRKNKVRELILSSVPAVAAARIQENGETLIDFHPNKPFAYEFDSDHVLHVTVTGMTAASRKKVQAAADKSHGKRKVVIH